MGASKPNAYSLFVKEMARKRQQRGESVNYASLFKELDGLWRGLSDDERQQYKDLAKNGGSDSSTIGSMPSQTRPSTSEDSKSAELIPPVMHRAKAGKEGTTNQIAELGDATSNDSPPQQSSRDLKRPHDGYVSEGALLPVIKKARPGIPNWRNLKNMNVTPSERYEDLPLINLKDKCEKIIETHEAGLMSLPLYSISANVLCKTKDGTFVPIELSVFSYSIGQGRLAKPYHVIIDSGSPPMGCVNRATDHQIKHKITFTPRGQYPTCARKDYKVIYKELLDYTRPGERTVLIQDMRDFPMIKGSIEWLYQKACEDGTRFPRASSWTILPVTEFITAMHDHVYTQMLGREPKFFLPYQIKHLLGCSLLGHNNVLKCDYHKKDDNDTIYCAQSLATRTIQNIIDILDDIQKGYKYATSRQLEPIDPNRDETLQVGRMQTVDLFTENAPTNLDPEAIDCDKSCVPLPIEDKLPEFV